MKEVKFENQTPESIDDFLRVISSSESDSSNAMATAIKRSVDKLFPEPDDDVLRMVSNLPMRQQGVLIRVQSVPEILGLDKVVKYRKNICTQYIQYRVSTGSQGRKDLVKLAESILMTEVLQRKAQSGGMFNKTIGKE